jgi:tRNA1Val (adenine37-N6)-methyltransferase
MASTKKKSADIFQFKQFTLQQDRCAMKVGTDGILLGAWAGVAGVKTVLDIGTGTGLIAIMLAQRAADASIHGVDIDELSCQQAKENVQSAPWSERLEIFHQPIQDFSRQHDYHYDLIVSNPPFFTGGTFSHEQDRNSVRHTVKLPHSDLLRVVQTMLSDKGRFAVVLPYIEGLRFQELAEGYNLHCNRVTEVLPRAGRPVERLLMEFGREAKERQIDQLIIRDEGEGEVWTEEYIALTGAFYLKM